MTYRLGSDTEADDDDEREESQEGEAFGNECDVSKLDKDNCADILRNCQKLGTRIVGESRRDAV